MINVAAEPFRMMASGNSEKLNPELIVFFFLAMEIGLLGSRIAYALKEPYLLVYVLLKQFGIDFPQSHHLK